ncbi:MAG: ABC transporter permease [Myxococcales bacterium]
MTLPGLAFRNSLLRNKVRALLTVLGIAVLTMAFVVIHTITSSFQEGPANARPDRLVVRSRISLAVPLPLSYFEKIKAVPGVTKATYSNWFGGTYIDRRNFFAKFAIDPDTYFDVYPEDVVDDPKQMEAFKADRTGALIGEATVAKYGFKVGDTVKIKGDIYPGDWAFHIDGIFHSADPFANGAMFFHWKYLDAAQDAARQGLVGTYDLVVSDPGRGAEVSQAIDSLFKSSAKETQTESEKTFLLAFISGSGVIIRALETVSVVMLLIMLLILGNTLMMALRERTNELGVLRTLGYHPRHLLSLALQEGVWLSAVGAVVGLAFSVVVARGVANAIPGFLNGNLALRWMGPALGIALAIGFCAALWPALRASRIDIVQALRRID